MPANEPNKQPSSSRKKFILLAATIAVVAGVYVIATIKGNEQLVQQAAKPQTNNVDIASEVGLNKSLSTGEMAAFVFKKDRPEVAPGEFKDGKGNTLNMSDWKGRVVLLNLWATWCGPCRAEMPHLAELQKLYGGPDFEVVALSVDLKGAEASSAFLKEIKADNLALYIDQTSKAMGRLGAIGLPLTLLVDRQGREIGRLIGPADWAGKEAQKLIEFAIAEKPES